MHAAVRRYEELKQQLAEAQAQAEIESDELEFQKAAAAAAAAVAVVRNKAVAGGAQRQEHKEAAQVGWEAGSCVRGRCFAWAGQERKEERAPRCVCMRASASTRGAAAL